MHKAVRLMPPVSIKGMVRSEHGLRSELWTVTQEEMNFLTEAANMAETVLPDHSLLFAQIPAALYRISGYLLDD